MRQSLFADGFRNLALARLSVNTRNSVLERFLAVLGVLGVLDILGVLHPLNFVNFCWSYHGRRHLASSVESRQGYFFGDHLLWKRYGLRSTFCGVVRRGIFLFGVSSFYIVITCVIIFGARDDGF